MLCVRGVSHADAGVALHTDAMTDTWKAVISRLSRFHLPANNQFLIEVTNSTSAKVPSRMGDGKTDGLINKIIQVINIRCLVLLQQ